MGSHSTTYITQLGDLPTELIELISENLPIASALSLAATRRLYRDALTDAIYSRHIRHGLHGDKPLWWACRQPHGNSATAVATAKRALRLGADPNAPVYAAPGTDQRLKTPLFLAITSSNVAMIELLLAYGATQCAYPMLHTAVRKGNLDVIRLLLSNLGGAGDHPASGVETKVAFNVADSRDMQGLPLLHVAGSISEPGAALAATRLFVERGARLDARNATGETALYQTVHTRDVATAQFLLDAGADVRALDFEGRTAIDHAIFALQLRGGPSGVRDSAEDGLAILRCMLAAYQGRTSPSYSSSSSPIPSLPGQRRDLGTALTHDAIHARLAEDRHNPELTTPALHLLLEAGLDVDACCPRTGRTPLWIRAGRTGGHLQQQRQQQQQQQQQHPGGSGGGGGSGRYEEGGNSDVVSLLLDFGAAIDFRDPQTGQTPLARAAATGNTSCVSLLLSRGADVAAAQDRAGRPLLAHAATGSADARLLRVLLAHGRQTGPGGETRPSDEMARQLRYVRARDGRSLLLMTAQHSQTAAEELLRGGADANAVDCAGVGALHLAVTNSYMTLSFGRLLLEKGVDIDARDARGWTPLVHAVLKGSVRGVEFLVNNGSRVETVHDCRGRGQRGAATAVDVAAERALERTTPLGLAVHDGMTDIASMLLAAGASLEAAEGGVPGSLDTYKSRTAAGMVALLARYRV
ncbi:ankyrin repeat domain-containing protein 50 [Microdochium nivale]|nr:ankyrin repeat domain-containing protein 50 [Microdochium nivale]